MTEIANKVSQPVPSLVIADLVCHTEQDEAKLRDIVKSTRVVLTAAGPFEKYGVVVHKLCAEEGYGQLNMCVCLCVRVRWCI